ncbi:hypothetical protein TanjilG_17581 [Lupinus angustifolius]|uniref:Protein kinase domain-containing protein n=1 Tax=Lupinus angustifolius TaxID=3871 RepID=A0A1J7GAL4_LUPAN|nr:hypothetical protein TanjilG_17581 [Lupinus angustifolius]
MWVVLPLILQLVKFCIIFSFVAVQGSNSKGPIVSPSPAFLPVINHIGEAPDPIHLGESWGSNAPSSPSERDGFVISASPTTLPVHPSPTEAPIILPLRDPWKTIAPSSPEVPKGPFLHPPVTLPLPHPTSAPTQHKRIEPFKSLSPSPSTITLSPPYKTVPAASTSQRNGTPTSAPVPRTSKGIESSISFSPSPTTITLSPPYEVVPAPSTSQQKGLSTSAPAPRQGKGIEPSISLSPSASIITLSPPYKAVPTPSNSQQDGLPTLAPAPRKNKGIEPSISFSPSPSTITLSPPYEAVPVPSTSQQKGLPTSSPAPRNSKEVEPSISFSPSPSTLTLSPPYEAVPAPSTAQRNVPISSQPRPPRRKPPVAWPPESTPTTPAPFAMPTSNLPKNAPISQPSPRTVTLSPSFPASSTAQGNVPSSIQPSPPSPQRKAHPVWPPASTRIAPAPVSIPSVNLSKQSPISQPIEHGNLPPKVDKRNANKSHTPGTVSPAPVATPSTNLPIISPVSQPTENGSSTNVHKEGANKAPIAASVPQHSPVSQPTEHGNFPPTFHKRNSNRSHILEPVSQAPVAIPPTIFPDDSPVSQPTHHGSFLPSVHDRTENKDHSHIQEPIPPEAIASPPWKMEDNQPAGHPLLRKIIPSSLPAPVTSPTIAIPVIASQDHPVTPMISPSKLPGGAEPVVSSALTPSRSFNWKKGGEPVSAPFYKAPKPLPPIVHSADHAAHKARQFHHAPKPPISSPEPPINKEDHFPASSPSTTFHKDNHMRNRITSPAPASSYFVSPPTSKHQEQLSPPSLLPTSGQRHHAPPPMDTGSSVSPFALPVLSPVSHVSPTPAPAPVPSFKISPHQPKIPLHTRKVSPYRSSSMIPKTPGLPPMQALPPPPPNEDCLSTICSEPYTNSPPGAPCGCFWPMKVGLRLSVSLYTFFPLVSELASEIATGVFMRQSQVRVMGANVDSQQPDKTVALIDLVPLMEEFDNTTAFLTSERFWHKEVAIKASYFGNYDVLYVSYPGLPPSPPLPPSSMTIIDGGPYSSDGNNGRTIKPLGVDIHKRQQHKSRLSKGIIAIITLSAFLAVILCSAAAWALFKYRDHVNQSAPTSLVLPPPLAKATGTAGSLVGGGVASTSSSFRSSIAAYTGSAKTFSMSEIEKATDHFNDSRIIGEGGFGRVYSGILEDGTKVAVKVLKREDHHGDREFLAEVEMLSRLHHRNLVKLIGICSEVSLRCLVYELIPNGSVESHIHGVDTENDRLDWSVRLKIALGAARGLAYLHEDSSPPVIHRDFKSSNILLEDDFTPKVSDFGLARIASDEENRHVSTRVMGTFGYVAPEYAMTGHLLVKSDVYSYGVVVLELLTGRKPVDMSQPPGQENLVSWARPLLTSKEGLEAIVHPSLRTNVPFESVAKVAAIASMCVQPEVSDRPFMGEVVQALKLVCDEAKEAGSKVSSVEDLSVVDLNNVSAHQPDNFLRQFSATNYNSGVDFEKGLSASELFSSSARFGRQASGSFRRHSYSGPLRTGRSRRMWQIIRRLSGGSVSEHGIKYKL